MTKRQLCEVLNEFDDAAIVSIFDNDGNEYTITNVSKQVFSCEESKISVDVKIKKWNSPPISGHSEPQDEIHIRRYKKYES